MLNDLCELVDVGDPLDGVAEDEDEGNDEADLGHPDVLLAKLRAGLVGASNPGDQ